MKPWKRSGFTLIELLVVIAIIGVLSTLAIIALGSARQKARDGKRVADMDQLHNALELFYTDNGYYPTAITPGQTLASPNGTVYMTVIPNDPAPRNDGTCPNTNYQYSLGSSAEGYTIHFCLGASSGTAQSGMNYLTANGVNGDASLIGWWKMGEGSGASLSDSSSTGATGTLTNSPTWTADSPTGSGYSLTTNGTNSYVNIPANATLRPSNVSVSVWVKWTGDTDGAIVGMQNNGAGADGYGLVLSGGNIAFWIYAVGNPDVIGNGGALTLNAWNHVVGTFDGNAGKKIYVNGVMVQNRVTQYGSLTYQNNPLRFGHNAGAGYLSSQIGEVRIYNRVLSLAEVQALYNAGH